MNKTETKELLPEDWKFCALIYIHVSDLEEDIIQFKNHVIRIFKPNDIEIDFAHVVEVYSIFSEYSDIKSAYHGSLEILNQFLDRIALLTFKPCPLIQPVGISCFKVVVNQEFDLLVPDDLSNELPKLDVKFSGNSNLLKNLEDTEIEDALRELRLGLESESIFDKFLHYYNVIERIADLQTEIFAEQKCASCGTIYQLPFKATGNKMKDLFAIEGFSSKEFKLCRGIRGKIAHGSAKRNQKLIDEIFNNMGKVEKVAANNISKITGINIVSGKIPRLYNQFWLLRGIKLSEKNETQNAAYNSISFDFECNSIFNKVNDIEEDNLELKPLVGPIPSDLSSENFKIYPYSWPY